MPCKPQNAFELHEATRTENIRVACPAGLLGAGRGGGKAMRARYHRLAVWSLAWPGHVAPEQLCLPVFQLGFYKGPAGSQVTLSSLGNQTRVLLEEQARHLLNERERATMAYYLEQYRGGSVSVEALVMALFELLNTHAKVTCTPPWARERLAGGWWGAAAAVRGSASPLPPTVLAPLLRTHQALGLN